MKAISKRKHIAMITTLQKLHELEQMGAWAADCFVSTTYGQKFSQEIFY